MSETPSAEKDALRSIWRELADKRIEQGVDWPSIVRILFRDLDRAEAALAAVEALIGPDEVFPNWSKYPHMHRVTSRRSDLGGVEVTTTMVDERALRAALGTPVASSGASQ